MSELLIRNGFVYDPMNGIEGEKADISIRNGQVVESVGVGADVIDASDMVSQSVAKPDEARQLVGDSNLWTMFENELRGALQRVSDANIVRR